MTHRYAQIDENGYIISDSWLSGEIEADNMIPIELDFDLTNKKWDYETSEWVEYIPESIPVTSPESSNEERFENIEDSVTNLEEALVEQYEANMVLEEELISTQEALVEQYESNLALTEELDSTKKELENTQFALTEIYEDNLALRQQLQDANII